MWWVNHSTGKIIIIGRQKWNGNVNKLLPTMDVISWSFVSWLCADIMELWNMNQLKCFDLPAHIDLWNGWVPLPKSWVVMSATWLFMQKIRKIYECFGISIWKRIWLQITHLFSSSFVGIFLLNDSIYHLGIL